MKENDIIKERYRLLRPLGAGGFGEVWLAKDQIIGTNCALKFYVRLDDKGREEFRDEYKRMLGIHDAHLLTASYYDEWQGRPFLVMDYCGGGAASDKKGQLSETELWRLIRDVASGLACLHSQRDAQGKEAPVIHQDIKPANFLQKGDGTWLISDFGISSRMRSSMSSQSGREVSSGGTIPYMGPERFGQGKMLVKSSDIWALGASIYEMATKDLPFDEYGGILQKKGEEIPHLPKGRWSSDLDSLMSSCLQKETWDRPSAALVAEYADCKLKGKPLPRLQALQSEPQKQINIADVVESVRRAKIQENGNMGTNRYFCNNCGNESQRWFGKCPKCNSWNTCVDKATVSKTKSLSHDTPQERSVKNDLKVGNNINVADVVDVNQGAQQKSENNDSEKETKRKEAWEIVDSVWIGVKKVLKYGGLACCIGVAIYIVYLAITTDYKITWYGSGGFATLMYATYRLSKWDVEK